jgi:hypothetical protein
LLLKQLTSSIKFEDGVLVNAGRSIPEKFVYFSLKPLFKFISVFSIAFHFIRDKCFDRVANSSTNDVFVGFYLFEKIMENGDIMLRLIGITSVG